MQPNTHRWAAAALAFAVVATAYAAYTAVALSRSFMQLDIGFTAASAPAAGPQSHQTSASLGLAPGPAAHSAANDGARAPVGSSAVVERVRPAAPSAPVAYDSTLDLPEEDVNILRQRALLDAAANPELAELLNNPDPDVRKAALDFFEDN